MSLEGDSLRDEPKRINQHFTSATHQGAKHWKINGLFPPPPVLEPPSEVLTQQWIVDLFEVVLGWERRFVVVVVKILFLETRTVQDVGQDERWTVEGRAGDPRDRIVLRTGHTHAVQTVARFLLQH